MDFVTPIIDIISRLWDCSATRANYLCELKQNLNALMSSFVKLKDRRDDVKARIHNAESNPTEPAKRTNEVSGWLQRVETLEPEIGDILREGANNGGSWFCCWGRYKLGKLVVEKLNDVDKLWNEGVFQAVVDKCQPDPVREISADQALGMESKLEQVWRLLADEESVVRIIGLYGMGGVGKTTLLKSVNNEFLKRNHHFDLVIWVVVSKELNIKDIQKQIGKSLGLSWAEDANINEVAKDITQVLKNKKFVLLLDDIWERVDLKAVGVPILTNSRVVFTTRSESVCGFMEAHKKIKVECLQWDEAWSLFQKEVGQQVINCHPNIPELAKQVAKECLGLPLALITVGRTMASKTTPQQWQYAVAVLRRSASVFSGLVEGVFAILKFSYDNLQSEKLKSCFLYCSLYPEDYSIRKDELIGLWIGEGFLEAVDDDIDEAYNEGHDVIESLKSACLLENGNSLKGNEVKMHDVVRELAIWIASDLGKSKGKYLTVQAESQLKLQEWEKAEKICLVGNISIKEIVGAPNCLNLSTLLLQNSNVHSISDDFFQSMTMLKVLNMSNLDIMKLPTSIFSLTNLQYLNLSRVHRRFGVVKLSPGGLVCLTKLKMLDMSDSELCEYWEVEGGPSLGELESLQDLNHLRIKLQTGVALQRLVSSYKLQLCTTLLDISRCRGITTLVLSPPSPSSPISSLASLSNMVSLKSLTVHWCDGLEELRISSWAGTEGKVTLFTTLEKIMIYDMDKLKIVWDVPQLSTFRFVNLKEVTISRCPEVNDVTWLIYAQNLETLELYYLDKLEEVISTTSRFGKEAMLMNNVFSRLKYLKLNELRNLKKICNPNVKFLILESITISACPLLRKLPFDINSVIPNTFQWIEGYQQWWDRLEWEDDTTRSNLAPYFRSSGKWFIDRYNP